jgi:hypothetical protein
LLLNFKLNLEIEKTQQKFLAYNNLIGNKLKPTASKFVAKGAPECRCNDDLSILLCNKDLPSPDVLKWRETVNFPIGDSNIPFASDVYGDSKIRVGRNDVTLPKIE